MIDAQQTLDLVKLRFYVDYLYQTHIYDEGDSQFHKDLTAQVVKEIIDKLELAKDAKILDLGCGPGYFLDEMKARGYTDCVGVTLSPGDVKICEDKGHKIKKYDLSFLPQKDGYDDESVDFIFLRHALEHSPYPIISLMEYNRVLKQNGKLYIEVPAPDCERKHEWNLNHYSILGKEQLVALLSRCGFDIQSFNEIKFDLNIGVNEDGTTKTAGEHYYSIVAVRKRALDVK